MHPNKYVGVVTHLNGTKVKPKLQATSSCKGKEEHASGVLSIKLTYSSTAASNKSSSLGMDFPPQFLAVEGCSETIALFGMEIYRIQVSLKKGTVQYVLCKNDHCSEAKTLSSYKEASHSTERRWPKHRTLKYPGERVHFNNYNKTKIVSNPS